MATAKSTSLLLTPQTIQILLGHGDGTFEIEPKALLIPPFSGQPSQYVLAVVAGDFDHDGKADFAFSACALPTDPAKVPRQSSCITERVTAPFLSR